MKLTRAEFAKLVGVDVRTVTRWETADGPRPTGAAEAILNGLNEKLTKDPDTADQVLKFVLGAVAVGGLAYLIVKLLDTASSKSK